MKSLARIARPTAAASVAVALALTGMASANAATVAPPTVADGTVSAQVTDPIPNSLRPLVVGQTCSGALVPLHAVPGLVGPLLEGGTADILSLLADGDDVTLLHLPGSPLLIATVVGKPGTLLANDVADDFYATAVICNGGNAPMETNLFLTQVGNPLGAFEGSVTGSVGGSGSAEGSSIGLGSAELGIGSENGMIDLGSTSGSNQGSTVDLGFHGSIADVTSGSTEAGIDVGSTGSAAGIEAGRGSLETGSGGELDTASLTGSMSDSVELPEGSSNGSSIDAGSVIPIATDIAGSVGDLSFPGS